jgi:hypothetical protein
MLSGSAAFFRHDGEENLVMCARLQATGLSEMESEKPGSLDESAGRCCC